MTTRGHRYILRAAQNVERVHRREREVLRHLASFSFLVLVPVDDTGAPSSLSKPGPSMGGALPRVKFCRTLF